MALARHDRAQCPGGVRISSIAFSGPMVTNPSERNPLGPIIQASLFILSGSAGGLLMVWDRNIRKTAGISRPVDLILTTFAALLVTAAVASEGRITESYHTEGGTDLQTIKSLNMLIQRAYLSEPGSGAVCIMHWEGGPVELTVNGSRSKLAFQTNIVMDQGALSLQDPGAIIQSVHSNGTHIIVEYNVQMNNLTMPAGDIALVITRTHDGIRLMLRP